MIPAAARGIQNDDFTAFPKVVFVEVIGVKLVLGVQKSREDLFGSAGIVAGNDRIQVAGRDLEFEISGSAFYQVNTNQMTRLYEKAREYAGLAGFHRDLPEFYGVALLRRLLIPAPAVALRLLVDGDFVLFDELADGIGHRHHRFFLKHAVVDVHYAIAASFPETHRRAVRTVVHGKSRFVPVMEIRLIAGNHNIPNQRMFQSADSGEFVFHVFFFHSELCFILHALEGAAAAAAEVRTYRFFSVRRRGNNEINIQWRKTMDKGTVVELTITDMTDDGKGIGHMDGLTVFDELGVKRLDNVSFTVNAGEVLGVAGVAGSGQRELLESIAGLYPIASGSVTYYDPADGKTKNLVGMDPMDIRKSGIAMSFVPEDRLGMGLVGSMGMTGNMMLRSWRKGHGVFLNRKDPEDLAQRIWQELEVVTPSTSFPVRRMSGGNVQKVLVGREIAQAPAVLMTAYAVRGLDINTSYTIYNLLTEQKMKGIAVMYVGEDLDVLLELCDRIVVLCGGQVSGVVDARTADKRQIGALMTRMEGGKTDE